MLSIFTFHLYVRSFFFFKEWHYILKVHSIRTEFERLVYSVDSFYAFRLSGLQVAGEPVAGHLVMDLLVRLQRSADNSPLAVTTVGSDDVTSPSSGTGEKQSKFDEYKDKILEELKKCNLH